MFHKKTFQLFASTLLSACFFASCESDMEKIKMVTENKKFPVERGIKIEMTYTDSGIVRVKMIAPLIERYQDERPYTEMKKGLTCYFYNSNYEVESMLKARYAIRWENEKLMEARDSVIVINTKGETLTAEQIFWNETTKKIYSKNKLVTITQKDQILYGYGFESNEDFTKYKIFKLKGIIKLNEETNAATAK